MTSDQKIALSINEACELVGLGRTALYKAIVDGALKARKAGDRTIILRADLQRWADDLPIADGRKSAG